MACITSIFLSDQRSSCHRCQCIMLYNAKNATQRRMTRSRSRIWSPVRGWALRIPSIPKRVIVLVACSSSPTGPCPAGNGRQRRLSAAGSPRYRLETRPMGPRNPAWCGCVGLERRVRACDGQREQPCHKLKTWAVVETHPLVDSFQPL